MLRLSPSRAGHLLCELESADLQARKEVPAGREFELVAFLEALKAPIWLGKRWIESPRGELYLAASHEGAGYVRLKAQLHATDPPYSWLVELRFRLRRSDLGPIIERARAVVSALAANEEGNKRL
jgi:Family of unknown function (DUF6228)